MAAHLSFLGSYHPERIISPPSYGKCRVTYSYSDAGRPQSSERIAAGEFAIRKSGAFVSVLKNALSRLRLPKEMFEFMLDFNGGSEGLYVRLLKGGRPESSEKKADFGDRIRLCLGELCISSFIIGLTLLLVPGANAVDALKTCTCLLKECRLELVKCIGNPSCAANIACLQTCNNRPDETECQIKCGDLFENSVVDEFNDCAVSRKKCVPQKSDVGEFPLPDPRALVENFKLDDFAGKWYITSGLNPTFDTFDCQVHEFHTESGKLFGNLTWRIRTPDSGFFTRSAVQRFVQDPKYPGILYNHNNEFLHYEDDWFILSSKVENAPDDYIFVYYRGRNDAWDGYGGAVVYTRSPVLPASIVPRLEEAARSVGRDFGQFRRTDNSCGPEPPLAERLERTVEEGEELIAKEVEEIEAEVGKVAETEMTLMQRLIKGFEEVVKDGDYFFREVSQEEMEILRGLKLEATEIEKLFSRALPIRKLR